MKLKYLIHPDDMIKIVGEMINQRKEEKAEQERKLREDEEERERQRIEAARVLKAKLFQQMLDVLTSDNCPAPRNLKQQIPDNQVE